VKIIGYSSRRKTVCIYMFGIKTAISYVFIIKKLKKA